MRVPVSSSVIAAFLYRPQLAMRLAEEIGIPWLARLSL